MKGYKVTSEQKELFQTLFGTYKKAMLSRKETAEVIGVSVATLDRLKADGVGVEYKKMVGKGANGTVKYPLQAIVRYLTENHVKTV